MKEIFLASLTPMLSIFLFLSLGFILEKFKALPSNASKVMAKLLTFLFLPALNFASLSKNFTIESIGIYSSFLILGIIMTTIALFVAIFIARFFVKDKTSYERRVYEYCLTFGNYGYVGAPLVIALFGMRGYSFLSFITLPCTVLVYTWGISALVPNGEKKLTTKEKVKRILNVPTIAVFAGVLFGITGLGKVLYQTPALTFITNCISDLSDCMVPTAMLLAGITVAKYDFKKTVSNKKVYLASLLRLILIPTVLVSIMYGIITLSNLIGINFDKSFLYLAFFVCATPPGLNIVVFPEAFGGDTSLSASFILVSYVLCVITIPLMFAILSVFLGPLPIF